MGALIIDYKLFPLGEEKKKKDTFKQSLLLKKKSTWTLFAIDTSCKRKN